MDGTPTTPPRPEPFHEPPTTLVSSCSSTGRRSRRTTTDSSNSPEFEFWLNRNPSNFTQPHLLSADQLFHDGFLLPLHAITHQPEPGPNLSSLAKITQQASETEPTTGSTGSKRWTDILFKKQDKSSSGHEEKKRETKSGSQSVELININIWPFSRSRSAGNSVTRPRLFSRSQLTRKKVSSAPCSRSNSSVHESKSRKWSSSPGRVGVHLGRTSPVWRVRSQTVGSVSKGGICSDRVAKREVTEPVEVKTKKSIKTKANNGSPRGGGENNLRGNKVLKLNVRSCIRYRHHLMSCKSDENSAVGIDGSSGGGRGGAGGGNGNVGSNVFNIRGLFMKNFY